MIFRITGWIRQPEEHRELGLVLLLACVHGLLFLLLVPPWQHYDEPSHLEYSWLIAHNRTFPATGEFNQALRQQLAASMVEHNFFRGKATNLSLISPINPVWIGVTQITKLPLYYVVVAGPLSLILSGDVTLQLYSARLISFIFFLISIIAAYGIVRELFPGKHPLVWMVPATLALLPGFVDVMTSINDDVGAAAIFSLFLWACVRLTVRGFTIPLFISVILLSGLCLFTKNTIAFAVPLALVPLTFSISIGKRRYLPWMILVSLAAMALVAMLGWGEAAHWYRQSSEQKVTRVEREDAPLGKFAFQLTRSAAPTSRVFQIIPANQVDRLRGKTLTLGAWIWAETAGKARTPMLSDETQSTYHEVEVGSKLKYFAFPVVLSNNAGRVQIILSTGTYTQGDPGKIFYDGITLIEGNHDPSTPPNFEDINGRKGVWQGQPFTNIIKNSSAEDSWPWVRPWADHTVGAYYPGRPSFFVPALLDLQAAQWYYQITVKQLLQTFWAKFGWAHVNLLGYRPYTILGIITLSGMLGALISFWRYRHKVPWEIITLFGAALVFVWIGTITRGISSIASGLIFIPSARYAYAAIVPTALILNIGWLEIFQGLQNRLRLRQWVLRATFFSFFLILDSVALFSLYSFYYRA